MAEHQKVDEPRLDVTHKHIRQFRIDEYKEKAPSDAELKRMARTVASLEGVQRGLEFTFGYTGMYFTIPDPSDPDAVNEWLKPEDPREASEHTGDTSKLTSLTGIDGYEKHSGHRVNLMCGNPRVIGEYKSVLRDADGITRIFAITNTTKDGASSTLKNGSRLSNFYMVDFLTEEEIARHELGDNSTLDEFN